MKSLVRRLGSESGELRPVQYVLILMAIALVYSLVMYFPSLMHQMAMANIADEAAARMNVDNNPAGIKKQVVDNANNQGIHVGSQDVILTWRDPAAKGANTVVIRWQEQIDHLWGSTQILKKKASAKSSLGEMAGAVKGSK